MKSLEVVKTPSRESPVIIEKDPSSSDDPDVEMVEDEAEKRVSFRRGNAIENIIAKKLAEVKVKRLISKLSIN